MTPELKQGTMRNVLIDYILNFKSVTDAYTAECLRELLDENIIAIAERIYVERQLEKSKPQEDEPCAMCGQTNCDYC